MNDVQATTLAEVKDLYQELERKIKTLHEVSDDIEEKTALGIRINSMQKALNQRLEDLKVEIRKYAKEKSGDSGETIEIDTPEGNVQVTFREDRVYVAIEDSDKVSHLREEVLTEVAFDALFEERSVFDLEEEYEEALKALSDLQRERVNEVLSKTVFKPSVRFPNV